MINLHGKSWLSNAVLRKTAAVVGAFIFSAIEAHAAPRPPDAAHTMIEGEVLCVGSDLGSCVYFSSIIGTGKQVGVLVPSAITAVSITNIGTISGGEISSEKYDAILLSEGGLTGGISNSGTILGKDNGINLVQSTVGGAFVNTGTITGEKNAGLNLEATSTIIGGVSNSGTIGARDYGIYIIGSTVQGGIANSGLIEGTGQYGIYVGTGSTVSGGIHNNSGGTITGGIANTGLITATDSAIL